MSNSVRSEQDRKPFSPPEGDLAQLLAGLERQREDLGPIADELIDLLRRYQATLPKPRANHA